MFRFTIAIQIICLMLSFLFGPFAYGYEYKDNNDVLIRQISGIIKAKLQFADDKPIVDCLERLRERDTQKEFCYCAEQVIQALENSDDDNSTALLCWHLLIELAEPSQINQGFHNTCALAALEKILCYKDPSLLCNLVLQARSGKILLSNERVIILPGSNLRPDRESRSFRRGGGFRSYAGQLFQIAAANAFWQSQNVDPRGIEIKPGSIMYVQDFEKESGKKGDTGERLIIKWSDNLSEYVTDGSAWGPCFDLDRLAVTFQLLTGKTTFPPLLVYKSRGAGRNVTKFGSEEDLRRNLLQFKRQGELPAIVSINPANLSCRKARFYRADGGGRIIYLYSSSNADIWHVLCIIDYDENKDIVKLDNSWGPSARGNNSQSVHSLFAESLPFAVRNSETAASANHGVKQSGQFRAGSRAV